MGLRLNACKCVKVEVKVEEGVRAGSQINIARRPTFNHARSARKCASVYGRKRRGPEGYYHVTHPFVIIAGESMGPATAVIHPYPSHVSAPPNIVRPTNNRHLTKTEHSGRCWMHRFSTKAFVPYDNRSVYNLQASPAGPGKSIDFSRLLVTSFQW
ncbi:hypothetical protein J6590_063358 [Homalodisca vitripennis]|nr:hypothetical protein J6590_063358 [Homalodisca vitripennis]